MPRSLALLIIIPACLLSFLGLTVLASVAPAKLLPQAIFLVLAIFAGWWVYKSDIENWLFGAKPLYMATLILLLATFIYGKAVRGSTRWIQIGSVRIQASELAKPTLILLFSASLSTGWPRKRKDQFKKFSRAVGSVVPAVALVMAQPDLGTAIILVIIAGTLLWTSGMPRWIIALSLLLCFLTIPIAEHALKAYQLDRIEAFLNPYSDPKGAGYNVIQSTIAVGSGQLFGRGLGHGTQSQLKFLPERQTDFIFASLVEELGLLGGVIVVALYGVLLFGLFKGIRSANRPDYQLVLTGCAALFFFQSGVNIAMNLGLAPITGITLPFLSAGGSSLITSGMIIGLSVACLH